MNQKNLLNELIREFSNNIITGANHEKEVFNSLAVDIPDKEMFYTYLVLWESWMFFTALGMVNPPRGEEIFNKTLIETAGSLKKITLQRFLSLSQQLFPLFNSSYSDPDKKKLPDLLESLLFEKEKAVDGFQEYVWKVTTTLIDFHQKTIREVLT